MLIADRLMLVSTIAGRGAGSGSDDPSGAGAGLSSPLPLPAGAGVESLAPEVLREELPVRHSRT